MGEVGWVDWASPFPSVGTCLVAVSAAERHAPLAEAGGAVGWSEQRRWRSSQR